MGASQGKRKKSRRNKIDGPFLALPVAVIKSAEYISLSHAARCLLIDIFAQYNGQNNGKLVCCMKYLKPLGWTSNETITRCRRQLIERGLLIQTRQGMMPPCSRAAWFAIGWRDLDQTEGIDFNPRVYRRCQLTPIKATSPIIGANQHR